MKKRDAGGEAMVAGKKNGPDMVDNACDAVKEALRRGDVERFTAAAKTLLNGGVSFTVSDSRYGCGIAVHYNLRHLGVSEWRLIGSDFRLQI